MQLDALRTDALYINKEASKETMNIKQSLANKCAIYNKEASKEMLNVIRRLANKCAIYNKEAKKGDVEYKKQKQSCWVS